MDYRTALLAHGGCAFELEARADTGEERLWELTLACSLDPEGNGTVTVLAPESIAGVTAVTEGGRNSLRYEELCLGLGELPGTELAPASVPGRLVRAWAEDWIASAGADGEGLLACYEDGGLIVRTWFDAEGVPLRAELAADGQTRFSAEIRDFTWNQAPQRPTSRAPRNNHQFTMESRRYE